MPPAGWFVFGIYLDVYIFLDIFGTVFAHTSCGTVCLAGSFLRSNKWDALDTSIYWMRLYIGHLYWDILMRMQLDEMILDGFDWTLIFVWSNFWTCWKRFFGLSDMLASDKTNSMWYIEHWVVLDEKDKLYKRLLDIEMIGWKHLTRQILSELLDIEICWMTNIGPEDLLDYKYWAGGFFGWKILDGRIFWMKNIGL